MGDGIGMRFESKKDVLLAVIVWSAIIIGFIATIVASAESRAALPGLLIMVAVMLLWSWLWSGTYYVLSEHGLIVRSGPLRRIIPVGEIETVRPSRNPLSAPALSLDRLEVAYVAGDSEKRRTILISPDDRDAFVGELRRLNPAVQLLS